MNELFKIIKDLVRSRFYGELVIKFDAGKIIGVKKTENIDPKQFNQTTSI